MKAGIDLGTMAAAVAVAAGGRGGDAGIPPNAAPAATSSGREPVAAFDFYWDEGDRVYRMRDPVVSTPDGEELECEFPEQLDFGKKYYCVVGVDKDGGYEAKVVPEGEVDGSEYDSWWKVPLFTVPHEKQEDNEEDAEAGKQYHVGAVVVGGGATPDNVSTELRSDGKLQVKGWDTGTPTSTAVAADLAATQGTGDQVVVRKSDGSLAYKPMGRIVRGNDSNIKITPTSGGDLEIDVYYL